MNEDYLEHNPETPPLYLPDGRGGWAKKPGVTAPVRYHTEPKGLEEWTDIPTTLCRGWGDCEDLSCWRVAEYRRAGIPAKPHFTWRKIAPGVTLYHIQVLMPNGTVEDPSRVLGMGDGHDR